MSGASEVTDARGVQVPDVSAGVLSLICNAQRMRRELRQGAYDRDCWMSDGDASTSSVAQDQSNMETLLVHVRAGFLCSGCDPCFNSRRRACGGPTRTGVTMGTYARKLL
jgi:hypothetical protein